MKAALRRPGYNDQRELATTVVLDDQSAMPAIGGDADYKTKVVIFNLRETPIAHMRHQKLIDDADYLAAEKFRATVEAARIGGSGVIDPERIRVDGNVVAEVQDRVIDAVRELAKMQGKLGVQDFSLLFQACPVGETLVNITRRFYPVEAGSRAEKTRSVYVGQRIRDGLKIVAEHFGLADPRCSRFYRSLSEVHTRG
jgi:hypothetical protein